VVKATAVPEPEVKDILLLTDVVLSAVVNDRVITGLILTLMYANPLVTPFTFTVFKLKDAGGGVDLLVVSRLFEHANSRTVNITNTKYSFRIFMPVYTPNGPIYPAKDVCKKGCRIFKSGNP
jgi:hypothetical protein